MEQGSGSNQSGLLSNHPATKKCKKGTLLKERLPSRLLDSQASCALPPFLSLSPSPLGCTDEFEGGCQA